MSNKQIVAGSVKRKIVASDLAEERSNCNFDQHELLVMLSGGQFIYNVK